MRKTQCTAPARVCPQHIQNIASQRLADLFVRSDPEQHPLILQLLFWAALRLSSLAAACRNLLNGPSDQTVRTHLLKALPKRITTLERRCHDTFLQDLPRRWRRGRRRIAIDWHSVPYHGEAYRSENEFRRSKPDQGTTTFHVYATAAIVHHGERFTIALTNVTARDSNITVLKRIIAQIRQTGLKIEVLLLDRQFSNGPVIALLQEEKLPFVMPAVFRGRTPKSARKATGFRKFKTARPGW